MNKRLHTKRQFLCAKYILAHPWLFRMIALVYAIATISFAFNEDGYFTSVVIIPLFLQFGGLILGYACRLQFYLLRFFKSLNEGLDVSSYSNSWLGAARLVALSPLVFIGTLAFGFTVIGLKGILFSCVFLSMITHIAPRSALDEIDVWLEANADSTPP